MATAWEPSLPHSQMLLAQGNTQSTGIVISMIDLVGQSCVKD